MTALLGILRSHDCFSGLPSDARTLVQTPSRVHVVPVEPGYYSHIGLIRNLQKILKKIKETVTHIELLINIDGMLLFRSSATEVWPILGIVGNVPSLRKHDFPIGVFGGKGKPKNNVSYLQGFVNEIRSLIREGFEVGGKLITVSVKGFICDAPAKAFILNVKGHTGYYSCMCMQPGVWVHNSMTFSECDAAERTNESFLRQNDEDYHTGETLLTRIPRIDFLRAFPLDYMHLVCLGVVCTLIFMEFWPGSCKITINFKSNVKRVNCFAGFHVKRIQQETSINNRN